VKQGPGFSAEASGERAISAEVISGIAVTGDNAAISARTVVLPAGGVPRADQVTIADGVSNLPRPPVQVFAGRDAELAQLVQALSTPGNAAARSAVVVYGLGGVGKSELALQYAHAHRDRYQLIWWITAADQGQIQAGLAALGARLCPEVALTGTTLDAARWGTGWLQAHTGWLLILDDVEDAGEVEALLAQLRGGRIVLTTRRDLDWQRLAIPVRLDILCPGPAAEILTAKTGQAAPADLQDAADIAAELGYLPLALFQAAAFIAQARLTLGGYLSRLRQQRARMLGTGAEGAQVTVTRLWDITLEAIRDRDPEAVNLLRVLVCYAPDGLPRAVIGGGDHGVGIDARLGLLASYSMITLTPGTVSIHRLLQAVILADQEDMAPQSPGPRDIALEWLAAMLSGARSSDPAAWPLLRALVPHAESVARHYTDDSQPEGLYRVLVQTGSFLSYQGDYERARVMRESALSIVQARPAPDPREVAASLAGLAATYRALGRKADALPLAQRAVRVAEGALGPDDPYMATLLGNLASTYRGLGQFADALPLFERALQVTETAFGPDHPDMAIRLANLAANYFSLGRFADALVLFERARRVTEAVLGPHHPDMSIRLGTLAATYRELGRPADALPLDQRARQITEATLGPHHPDMGIRLGNLAATYRDLGQPADALPLAEQAVQVTEATLGPDHPALAIRLANLAATRSALGQPADALPLHQRALRITEAAYGSDHPDTATRLESLAATYRALGQAAEAVPLERRASQLRNS
jgi:tetratricopeptide (TPR) repeat protein